MKDHKTSIIISIGELRDSKICPRFLISKDEHVEGVQPASIIVKDNESKFHLKSREETFFLKNIFLFQVVQAVIMTYDVKKCNF